MSLGFCMAAIFAFSSSEISVALFTREEEPVRSEEDIALDIGWWFGEQVYIRECMGDII